MMAEVDCSSSKPLALLIPGLDGTGRLYYRQTGRLEERYRVKACEFKQSSPFDFHHLVEQLAQDTFGESPGSILVVGESFGGTIAMHFVLAYPERVHALALINTFPYYRRRMRIVVGCRLAALLRWRCVNAVKNFIVERQLTSEGILEPDRIRYREIVKLVGFDAYRRRLELVREVNLLDRLVEIRVPTYLFASGRDKIVPAVDDGRIMASCIPHATLHEVPHAGHALLLTPGFYLADYL